MATLRIHSSALLLLPLILAAAAEGAKLPSTNFQAYLLGAGTAGAEDYYKDTHHVELVEQKVTNCRYFGCQNWVNTCSDGPAPQPEGCDACRIGNSWTSQFTCRKDAYGYQGGDNTLNFGQQLDQATGECYWDVLWYRSNNFNSATNATCGWVPVNSQTWRIGSATGRCFFPGGDKCGEPLCSTLRVTVSAEVIATEGYTRSLEGTNNDNDYFCTASGADFGCDFTQARLSKAFIPKSAEERVANGNNKAADKTKAGIASVNYNDQSDTFYPAHALAISGSITSINGQKNVKAGRYTDGSIQYVFAVQVSPGAAPVSYVPSDSVIVTPQAYSIEFAKGGARYNS